MTGHAAECDWCNYRVRDESKVGENHESVFCQPDDNREFGTFRPFE